MLRSSGNSTLFPSLRRRRLHDALRLGRVLCEQGASLIEDALALGILMTLMFGVIQVSLALYSYHSVSEAAREGTRYAIVRGSSCSGFTSACPAAASDVQTYIRGNGFAGLTSTSITVTTTWPTNNNPGSVVSVTVSYPFSL